MTKPPGDDTDPALRDDMDRALRFLHIMGMQTKNDVADLGARLLALVEELVAGGAVDLRALDERRERARARENERARSQAHVEVADAVDKYRIDGSPKIDCASLIPICKGRCCRLSFPLSFQDLDEGVLKFEYGAPYRIRKRLDQYCVHSDAATRACTVYQQRPAICRNYDCRNDRRIWLDFEQRIPAPDDAIGTATADGSPPRR